MDMKELYEIPPWEWPEDAPEIISKVLSDKTAPEADRLLAAELAGDNVVMDTDMAAFLLPFVKDTGESEKIRATAAVSFGAGLEYADLMEFDENDETISEEMFKEIQETFRTLYHDPNTPKIVRRKILEGSVRSPMDWHQKAIQEANSNDDTEWQMTAVFCMGYIRGFEDKILKALENENEDIFYEAVRAAGNMDITKAWPYIKELLLKEDIDKWLLIAAIEAAATVHPEEAEEILLDLSDSTDEDIALAAEDALTIAGMTGEEFDDDDYLDDEEL